MKGIVALILLALAGAAVWSSAYTVLEVEQVLMTQFGEPVGDPLTEPGLHWKVPFIQKVHRFDKRWLEWDGDASEMPTREKTYIWVDTYARWRITDPLKFFTSVHDEQGAQSRLDDIIEGETRNVVAAHNLIEVVRASNREFTTMTELLDEGSSRGTEAPKITVGRGKLAEMIIEKARAAMPAFGIELVDVQFQRVTYTESVRKKVYERMSSERRRIAQRHRSEGEGKSAEIIGRKERELKTIESEAYRRVQQIKGTADAEATTIYAQAYNRDPELYRMLKSLETYKKSVGDDTVLILSTDSDYFAPLVSMDNRR